MAVVPEKFQKRFLDALQYQMSFETLSAIHKMTVKKKMIEVLQDLSQPSRFDNYIDVMQQYIDLVHTILSEGATQPHPKFSGQGWAAEANLLFLHLNGFINKIKELASQWMGVDYKTKYEVDFLEPLKSLTTDNRISYIMAGYDTPPHLVPFFEDLKRRLVIMTENDNISSNQAEKATKVWIVCKILEDRAIFIANHLTSLMKKILTQDRTLVSINLKEIIALNAPAAVPTSVDNESDEFLKQLQTRADFSEVLKQLPKKDGGKRTKRHKRSDKRSNKRSNKKRSNKKKHRSNKRMSRRR